MKIKLWPVVLLICLFPGGQLVAADFCFLRAQNLYEQVYCELQAKGLDQTLPAYYEFQRNPPNTQYLLVMRPAKQLGVNLKPPLAHDSRVKPTAQKASENTQPADIPTSANTASFSLPTGTIVKGCTLDSSGLSCPSGKLRLVTNRHNKHLAPEALSAANTMVMPRYRGNPADGNALGIYLLEGYQRYLAKMVDIGLGGSTMSLAKFEQLYFSMADMDMDFSQRMEVLYRFLKKDKASLGVSETVKLPTLSLRACQPVGQRFISCPHNRQNYLFERREG